MKVEDILKVKPKEIEALINQFRPIFNATIDAASPIIYQFVERTAFAIAEVKMKTIEKYESAGFSRDDAINLVMNEWYAMARSLRNVGNTRTK